MCSGKTRNRILIPKPCPSAAARQRSEPPSLRMIEDVNVVKENTFRLAVHPQTHHKHKEEHQYLGECNASNRLPLCPIASIRLPDRTRTESPPLTRSVPVSPPPPLSLHSPHPRPLSRPHLATSGSRESINPDRTRAIFEHSSLR